MRGNERRLDRAPLPFALDDRVAEENDPVAAVELDGWLAVRLGGGEPGTGPDRHGEEQPSGQRQETARPRTRFGGHGGRFRSGRRGGSVASIAVAGGRPWRRRVLPIRTPDHYPTARIPESHR